MAAVLVSEQQVVTKGQSLFQLDVSVDRAQLEQTERQIDILVAENSQFAGILQGHTDVTGPPGDWISARIAAKVSNQQGQANRGAAPQRDVGVTQDKLLGLQSQISGQVSRRAALGQDHAQAEMSLTQARSEFESQLLDLFVPMKNNCLICANA